MTDTIKILPYNASHVKIDTELSIHYQITDHFKFRPAGYQFTPAYKQKIWSGFIELYNTRSRTLPIGLIPRLEKLAGMLEVEFDSTSYQNPSRNDSITLEEVKTFAESLNIHSGGKKIEPRDYQIHTVYEAIKRGRMIAIAPTSAGKSLILYIFINWFREKVKNKILLIVPSTQLVLQMLGDFKDYHNGNSDIENPDDYCHLIMGGKEKHDPNKKVFISTWQSLQNITKGKDKSHTLSYFNEFDLVISDECFHPDTKILMEDGNWKKIVDVMHGDCILNVDKNGDLKKDFVVKQHKNLKKSENHKMYKLTLEDGSVIKVTGNHKIMTTLNEWKTVDELNEGDDILWVENIELNMR